MKSKNSEVNEVDQYIQQFLPNTQKALQQLRNAITKAAPGAEEVISYKIPAYKFHGMLVYFAAYENHMGFYPTPSGIEAFKEELSAFKGAKGSVQFPLDKPLPLDLVSNIVKFRAKENLEKAEIKLHKKK